MARPVKHYNKWRIRWLDENGQRHSDTFDSREDALFALKRHEVEVEEIRRCLRGLSPPNKTFANLCDYWLANRAPQKRSKVHDESIIRCHLRPAFEKVQLRDLGVEKIDTFIVDHTFLNRKTIANILTLLISMLYKAIDLGWIVKAPRIHKPRIPLFNKDYSYLRTKEEIARFLHAAMARGALVFALYASAVYTGMREGELAGLYWEDVDLEHRLITVQRSFDGPTKSEDVRHVPILDVLLPILREWRLQCPTKLVFPNRDGVMFGKSARVFQEVFHRTLDAAGFAQIVRNGKPRRYVLFHDLRHTFASHWMLNHGDIFRLSKVLGHKSVQMTMRYAHLAPEAYVEDYGRLGQAAAPGARVIELKPQLH